MTIHTRCHRGMWNQIEEVGRPYRSRPSADERCELRRGQGQMRSRDAGLGGAGGGRGSGGTRGSAHASAQMHSVGGAPWQGDESTIVEERAQRLRRYARIGPFNL